MPQALVNSLRRIRRRLLLVRAAEAGLLGAIAAAPVAAAVTGVRILRPESVPLATAYPALPLALVACGFVLGFLVRLGMGVSLRQAALAADRAADLKERLATALEVLGQSPPASARVACPARRWLGMSQAQSGKHAQAKSSLGMPPAPGMLDERLVAQATDGAARLDVSRLPLARTAGRSVRVLLVAVLVLVAAAFIPPVGGPPVGRQEADRAAETLRLAAAAPESMHPDIRSQMSRAAQALARTGIRRAGADQATAAVFDAAARIEQARQATLDELQKVENPEIQEMARAAAAGGDAAQAVSQASKAADRLLGPPGAGAATEADRRRVADGLTGAASTALRQRLPELAAQLRACAEAMRRADAEAVRRTLQDLALRMTQDLGDRPGAGPRDLMAAVAEARRAMGLPDLPAPDAGGGAMQGPGSSAAAAAGSMGAGSKAGGSAPRVSGEAAAPAERQPLPAPAGSAEVRPEDREVVRRYFGG